MSISSSEIKTENCASVRNNDGQMDLENFQDLTDWCRPIVKAPEMATPPSIDELNTPVFGKNLNEFSTIITMIA